MTQGYLSIRWGFGTRIEIYFTFLHLPLFIKGKKMFELCLYVQVHNNSKIRIYSKKQMMAPTFFSFSFWWDFLVFDPLSTQVN